MNLALATAPEATYAVDSSEQLTRDRQQLQQEQEALRPLPHLPLLREKVTDAEGALAFDPDNLTKKANLSDAKRNLGEALDRHQKYTRLGNDISAVTSRLEVAQQRERQQAIEQVQTKLGAAQAAYKAAALQAAKAFREMLIANNRCLNVPGAGGMNIAAYTGFNVPHLAFDRGELIPLGQQMAGQSMPWEK